MAFWIALRISRNSFLQLKQETESISTVWYHAYWHIPNEVQAIVGVIGEQSLGSLALLMSLREGLLHGTGN